MERKIAGIDLGTTNSVIAVPGEYPEHGTVFGMVTVVHDEFERFTHASAVCSALGEVTVGNDALEMARQGYTPARFVKKYMGVAHVSRIGDKDHSPEEVSALVLKHLVGIAEKRLNVKIDRVVITHPAYFDGLAIQATRRAGQLAGLEVVELLEEPTAAAIAYSADAGAVVLVYDLGGGTFDVTVLARSGETFQRLRCGGNRELGGYNFDRKIALKMLDALQAKGYKLVIDPNHPERDPRWATLMYFAEKLKCELGRGAPKADVIQASVFQDDSTPNKAVQLRFAITQTEFRELIKPEIDETIREAKRVVEESGATPDVLVLVGGSSRIVAIQERLRAEFGLEPVNDDNILDLSVAVGAAAVASTLGTRDGNVTLKDIPLETPDLLLPIEGEIAKTPACPTVANLVVTVAGGQEPATTLTGPNGGFFVEVPLQAETENTLQLTIQAPDGSQLYQTTRIVSQSAGADRTERIVQRPMLAQAISVETDKGLEELAKEGAQLPFNGSQELRTKFELTAVPVTFYQDNVQLTSVELTGFSRPIPARSKVVVDIAISKDYELKVTVSAPQAGISKTQDLKLTPLQIPSIDELRRDFPEKRGAFQSQVQNSPAGDRTAAVAAEGFRLIDETEQMLAERLPEAMRIFLNMKRLDLLTWKLPRAASFDPPKADLLALLARCRQLLPAAIARQPDLKHQEYDKALDVIATQIPIAEREEDMESWAQIAKRLAQIENHLDDEEVEIPPPQILQGMLLQMVEEVRNLVRSDPRAQPSVKAAANKLLDEAVPKIRAVSMDNERSAQMQLIGIYQQHVKPAQDMLQGETTKTGRKSVLEKF